MKKQPIRRTALGPCAPRMKHRFAPGAGVEIDFNYVQKRCLNCGGTFWVNKPFAESMRNTTPSPSEIFDRLQKMQEEEQAEKEAQAAAARRRSQAAKRGAKTRKRKAAARKAAETRKRNAQAAQR